LGGSGVSSSSVAGSVGGGASTIASRFFHKHEAFVDKRRRLHEHLPIFDKTNVFAACGTIAPRGTTVERRVLNSLNERLRPRDGDCSIVKLLQIVLSGQCCNRMLLTEASWTPSLRPCALTFLPLRRGPLSPSSSAIMLSSVICNRLLM